MWTDFVRINYYASIGLLFKNFFGLNLLFQAINSLSFSQNGAFMSDVRLVYHYRSSEDIVARPRLVTDGGNHSLEHLF